MERGGGGESRAKEKEAGPTEGLAWPRVGKDSERKERGPMQHSGTIQAGAGQGASSMLGGQGQGKNCKADGEKAWPTRDVDGLGLGRNGMHRGDQARWYG